MFYYKRTASGNATNILDEGMVSVPYASNIYDAVILKNINIGSSNAFGVAILWGKSTGGAGISFYEWTPTGLTLIKQFTLTNNTVSSMNMDAIDLTYYSAVYTLNGSNIMYAFGGAVQVSGYPLVSTVKQINGNASSGTGGIFPDLAMTKLNNPPSSMNPSGIKLYYSYIGPNNDECIVSYLGFDQLMANAAPIALTYEHTVTPLTFAFYATSPCTINAVLPNPAIAPLSRFYGSFGPTIDAPDYSDDSWAVIVEQLETYGSFNGSGCFPPYSFGARVQLQVSAAYKIGSGPIHDIVLNNASISGPPDMSKNLTYPFTQALTSSQPAVAFAPSSQWINFAWGVTQPNGAMGGSFDYLGMAIDPATNSQIGTPYRIIDKNPGLTPYVHGIAFSGLNNGIDNLYTTFIADTSNTNSPYYQSEAVYQKHPKWSDIIPLGYKPTGIENQHKKTLNAVVKPNPFDESFTITVPVFAQDDIFEIRLSDITGRQLLFEKGKINEINSSLLKNLKNIGALSNSLYLLHIRSITSQEQTTLKLIKL